MTDYSSYNVSVSPSDIFAHIKFLKAVNSSEHLKQPHILLNALRRYEVFWLPLLVKHESETTNNTAPVLQPPLDVEWMWHVHLLAPYEYENNCNALISTIPADHKFHANKFEHDKAVTYTKSLWESLYVDEKYDFDGTDVPLIPSDHTSKINYDIIAACGRQSAFYYNVSLPHYVDPSFVEAAVIRYKKFLGLKKTNCDAFIVPMYDVDLVWHTHQLQHKLYKQETEVISGKMLNHDDTTTDRGANSKLTESDGITRKLWLDTYNEQFPIAGAMYRGKDCSASFFSVAGQGFHRYFATSCVIQVTSVSLKNHGKLAKLAGSIRLHSHIGVSCRRSEPLAEQKSDDAFQWSGVLLKSEMSSAALNHSSLKLEITKNAGMLKGLLGLKKIVSEHTFKLESLVQEMLSGSKELPKDMTFSLMSSDEKVEMSVKFSMVALENETFLLRKGPFTETELNNAQSYAWQPVSLPRLPDGIPNKILQATHRLVHRILFEIMFGLRTVEYLISV